MTVGELYRVMGMSLRVRIEQSSKTYYEGPAYDIPVHYMDSSIKYITAEQTYNNCNQRDLIPYVNIVLCE